MAHDHHRNFTSVDHPADRQLPRRANSNWRAFPGEESFTPDLSAVPRVNKHLRRSVDFDRAGAFVSEDAAARRRTPQYRPRADRRGRRKTEWVAAAHANASEPAHTDQPKNDHRLTIGRSSFSYCFSVQTLCALSLCGFFPKKYIDHRDTEHTKGAQREESQPFVFSNR